MPSASASPSGAPWEWGVNGVCTRAGTHKALLYRYSGDLDGLLQAHATSADFWPTVDEVTGSADDAASASTEDRIRRFVAAYVAALRARPRTLALLAWETAARNALTDRLETVREAWSTEVVQRLVNVAPRAATLDLPAIGADIAATAQYLLLRRRHIRTFGGLDLQADADQDRQVGMMAQMVLAVL